MPKDSLQPKYAKEANKNKHFELGMSEPNFALGMPRFEDHKQMAKYYNTLISMCIMHTKCIKHNINSNFLINGLNLYPPFLLF